MSNAANETLTEPLPTPSAHKVPLRQLAVVAKPGGNFAALIMKWVKLVLPPALGIAMFVGLWAIISTSNPNLPGPAKTWASAVQLFSHPFYQKGPNDQSIG